MEDGTGRSGLLSPIASNILVAVVATIAVLLCDRIFMVWPRMARRLVRWKLRRYGLDLERLIRVQDESWWGRLVWSPSLAFGEGYMKKQWSCDNLEEVLKIIITSPIVRSARPRFRLENVYRNLQGVLKSRRVADLHYNLGSDLFGAMLGPTMQYSCAWWEGVGDLQSAQEKKMEMLCRKLNLRPGLRVLDIGCGWGSLMRYMIEYYHVQVVGLNISGGQIQEALRLAPELDIREEDYRVFCADSRNFGTFDRVVSVGMFEHVGPKNYRTYFEGVKAVLKPDGLFVLHTIGGNRSTAYTDEWIDRYIFPGGVLPSITQIGAATEDLMVLENWINIGPYYATTLRHWRSRSLRFFTQLNESLDTLKTPRTSEAPRYDDTFQRAWYYYLTLCIILFQERKIQLWQLVLTPNGYRGDREDQEDHHTNTEHHQKVPHRSSGSSRSPRTHVLEEFSEHHEPMIPIETVLPCYGVSPPRTGS